VVLAQQHGILSYKRETDLEIRLKEIKEKVKEVENYERDKKTYEEKIAIIQNLKKSQRGPVHVIDEISRMLPDRVWLVSLKSPTAHREAETAKAHRG